MKLQDLPIKRKVMAVIMLTTLTVLVVTAAAFSLYTFAVIREDLVRSLSTLARVIADESAVPLALKDEKTATEIMSSLRNEPQVVVAVLYDARGDVFATYASASQSLRTPPVATNGPSTSATSGAAAEVSTGGPPQIVSDSSSALSQTAEYVFGDGQVTLSERVMHNGTRLGTFILKADTRYFRQSLRMFAALAALIVLCSLLLAFVISDRLQARISNPLITLASTARQVSLKHDYSVRAPDAGGDELGLLTDAFNQMLTQIQEQTVALRQNEQRLRLALGASHTGTWDWDLQTGRIIWDEYTAALFGLKADDFAGTYDSFLKLVHAEDRNPLERSVARTLEEEREFSGEFRIVWPDGSIHTMYARGKALKDDSGKPVRMIGVTQDITERKLAEQQILQMNAILEQRVRERTAELTAANHELEAFTYSVAHDLRAPLRHIDAFSKILFDEFSEKIPPDARPLLETIRKGSQSMSRLVDDLLNLARVGRQELKRERTPLNPVVEEVIAELKRETGGRQIEWHVGQLPEMDSDPGLIKQVFANLLSNAVKYTRPRNKAIIEIGQREIGGETVIFVQDNGVGFNMKYADKLFGVFQRLHRADEFEGTGVGLATVDRIVRKHGGRIWAEAEVDKGATFYFTVNGSEKKDHQRQREGSDEQPGGTHVKIVQD